MKTIPHIIKAIVFTIFIFSSCEKDSMHEGQFSSTEFISEGKYAGEYWPTDGWRYCHPQEVGMDAKLLSKVNEEILILQRLHVDIHSVTIVKNGYIVAEQFYSEKYTRDSLHRINSCTKSITSALMGIAINEGFINSVDARIFDFFPEYELENMSPEKETITIENMLTMSAGFEWYEMEFPYDDDRNSFYQFVRSADRNKFVLDLPLLTSPGEDFNYNSGVSHVLSSIIQKSTSTRTDLFAKEKLFSPIGIFDFFWYIDPEGYPTGGHGVFLKPGDMAKIGYLYLNSGNWDGQQLIPEDWIKSSSFPYIQRKYITEFYYGYQWWVKPNAYFTAVGINGQWIYIVPEHDLLVVFTNDLNENENLQVTTPERLVNTYILPAVK